MSPTEPTRRALDVSRLPSFAFGHRDPMWWGIIALLAIEGMGFVFLYVAYFYIRGNQHVWPPSAMPYATFIAATTVSVALLCSGGCALRMNHWAKKGKLFPTRRWLGCVSAFSVVALAARAYEFASLPFRWDSHGHGSVFWVLLGMHTFHAVTSFGENTTMYALLHKGPVEKRHMVDVEGNGFYWYFIVITQLVTYAILYLDPSVLAVLT